MARGYKKKKITKRTLTTLVIGLLAVLLMTLMALVPGFEAGMRRVLGIDEARLVPDIQALTHSPVAVHFIDVGQGDAVLLQAQGAYALIDAGPPEGEAELLAYLREMGVKELQYIFMTHPHADHIGGMQAVLEAVTVKIVVLPDFSKAPLPTTKTFEDILATMEKQSVAAKTAKTGDEYPLGSGKISVLSDGLATKDNYNLLSPALLFEAGGLRFMDTGDAEAANERALIESGADVRADLFKAGHHGSSTSNTADFLAAMCPTIAVVSSGQSNSYGHPHREVVEAFAALGTEVLRTDQSGSVVVAPGEDGGFVYAVSR